MGWVGLAKSLGQRATGTVRNSLDSTPQSPRYSELLPCDRAAPKTVATLACNSAASATHSNEAPLFRPAGRERGWGSEWGKQTWLALGGIFAFLAFCIPPLSPQPPFHPRRGGKGELHLTSRFGAEITGEGCGCFGWGEISEGEFRAPGGLQGLGWLGAGHFRPG